MKEYAKLEKKLNEFFAEINFCLPNCISKRKSLYNKESSRKSLFGSSGKYGCCTKDQNYVNIEFFSEKDVEKVSKFHKNQEKDYRLTPTKKGCPNHTTKGCSIISLKSPKCLSYICGEFRKYLEEEYNIEYNELKIEEFFENIILEKKKEKEITLFYDKIEKAIQRIKRKDKSEKIYLI